MQLCTYVNNVYHRLLALIIVTMYNNYTIVKVFF